MYNNLIKYTPSRKLVKLDDLHSGEHFFKDKAEYVKTDLFSSSDESVACANVDNGRVVYFFISTFVYIDRKSIDLKACKMSQIVLGEKFFFEGKLMISEDLFEEVHGVVHKLAIDLEDGVEYRVPLDTIVEPVVVKEIIYGECSDD